MKYWCIHSLPYVVEGVGEAAHVKQLVVHNFDSPRRHIIDRFCHFDSPHRHIIDRGSVTLIVLIATSLTEALSL